MSEPISELAFNTFPQAVKDWIQELGLKREDVNSVQVKYEMIKTNASDEEWAKWRHGNHVDVIIYKSQERKEQRFIRLNDENWQKA